MQQSYDLQLKSDFHWPVPYLYMGKIYDAKANYARALQLYRLSLYADAPQTDSIKAYLAFAETFKKMNLPDSGINYAKLAYSIAQTTSIYLYTSKSSSFLIS